MVKINASAAEIGAPDLLAAVFDRVANPGYAVAHYGLYLGIGNADPGMVAEQIAGPYDGPEPFAQEHPAEYQALCYITRNVNSGTMRSVAGIESAVPGDLNKVDDNSDWEITHYVGAGVFSETGTYEDEDLRRFLSGDDLGQSQITFGGSANPRVKSRWTSFCKQVEASLAGNEDWGILVPAWLESAAAYPGDIDVWVKVYNPCDLVQTILSGWPDRVLEYVPLVEGRVGRRGAGEILLIGELCWDGRSGVNVPEHIGEVYRDPLHWFTVRNAGMAWAFDRKLIGRMGLRYILHETVLEPAPSEPGVLAPRDRTIWIADGGKARRVTTRNPDEYYAVLAELNRDGRLLTVDDYLVANPGQVDAAVRNYRYHIGLPPRS